LEPLDRLEGTIDAGHVGRIGLTVDEQGLSPSEIAEGFRAQLLSSR
jgi:hypothetical protein